MIGFGSTFHWLTKWREFFKPIATQVTTSLSRTTQPPSKSCKSLDEDLPRVPEVFHARFPVPVMSVLFFSKLRRSCATREKKPLVPRVTKT